MSDLFALIALSLRRPAEAARALLALRLPNGAVWMGVGIVACLGVLSSWIGQAITITDPTLAELMAQISPLFFAVFTVVTLALSAFAFFQTGRVLGGQGSFRDVLLAVTWVQAVLVAAQVALIALSVLIPAVAGLLSLAVFVWSLIAVIVFLREAHQFQGTGRAIGTFLMGIALLGFALSFLMGLAGPAGVSPNGL